ncbi:MAG: fibronectin type III domain-containing protein, partial [Thermoguttaceae bacterium]|nr:fibronectin type III domain-containing protein [Thermoguttaceae bacterium]
SVVSGTLDVPTATVIEEGVDSLTVSWNSIPRAQRYAISYRAADSEEWTTISLAKNAPELIVDGSTVAYRVEGLAPNTSYEVTVQARGNNTSLVHSEVSESVFGVTLDDSLRLDGVVGDCEAGGTLTAALATDATASYQWYRETGADEWVEITGATSASYQTTSEDVGKRVLVVATSAEGEVYHGVDYASSEAAVWTRLTAPTLRVESAADGVVTLAWDAVANANGYQLAARIAGEELCDVLTFGADETSITLMGFEEDKTYEFKIMAIGSSDVYASSEYGEPISVRAYAEALSVTSYDPETRVATIEWGAISGASKYMVKLSKDGGATWSNYKTTVTTTSLAVNGLYTGKAYALRVIGMASDGTQLDGGSEIAFAPVSATSSVQDYTVGTPITLKLSAASNATATIQWYFVTNEGDVEIVSARNQLSYTPTTADYDITVVTTGTGDSAPCVYTQTIARPIDAAPITVRSYDAETRIATIRWDPMPDAATYTVKISKDGGATWVDYIKKIPSKNNYKGINGIYAGRSYDFRVYG